jgi:hypothetical protein
MVYVLSPEDEGPCDGILMHARTRQAGKSASIAPFTLKRPLNLKHNKVRIVGS